MSTTLFANAAAKRKLEASDSCVVFETRDSTGSSFSAPPPSKSSPYGHYHHFNEPNSPIAIGLSIRRGRLAMLTTLMVALIVGLVVTFHSGVEILRFESSSLNDTQRAELLDDYNSYSGNAATAFAKPVEIFVTVAVQVIMLRFMAHAIMQAESSWSASIVTLVVGAGVGYMISNGFNALNVQLRPQPIEPVITASDLSQFAVESDANISARTTNVTHTISEATSQNLISNTVFRDIVLPRVAMPQMRCNWFGSASNTGMGDIPLPSFDFGFTRRDWQNRILHQAVPTKQLRLTVNPTDASVNQNVNSSELPMNASLAADLLLYSLYLGQWIFPWGDSGDFGNATYVSEKYPISEGDPTIERIISGPTARTVGLLPFEKTEDEMAERAWFQEQSVAAVARQFVNAKNTSQSDIVLEFSHLEVSPGITFDAVTIEVDHDPMLLASEANADNTTRSTNILQAGSAAGVQNCGPWPGLCLLPKPEYKPNGLLAFNAPQVQAFAACINADGTEELRWNLSFPITQGSFGGGSNFDCESGSNASVLIMSVANRLVADALVQLNSSTKTAGVFSDSESAVITNLRKIYSFTIGRLAWQDEDLSTLFHAKCNATDTPHKCHGLQFLLSSPLGATSKSDVKDQHVVVSADALPVDLLAPPKTMRYQKPRFLPLVQIHELPEIHAIRPIYDIVAGDVLLPHNIKSIDWNMSQTIHDQKCNTYIEQRLHMTLNNHMYMEHSLQPAYTAATFFLLQNGVVQDRIQLGADAMTLSFQNNVQEIAVWLSTPQQNLWLTLGGCLLLVGGLLAAVLHTMWLQSTNRDPLAAISAPQVIARVMLDMNQFPPALLHRRVVDSHDVVKPFEVDQFWIDGLSLQHQDDDGHRLTAVV